MIIKKVRACGFEYLFNGYKEAAKIGKSGFGSGLSNYIQHVMLTIELEDLTTMELFYLKRMCGDVKILGKTYQNFVSKEKQADVYQKVESILAIRDEMVKDSDIDTKVCDIDNILPVGCESYHVISFFKGDAIMAITGGVISEIFSEPIELKTVDPNTKKEEITHTYKTWDSYKGDEAMEEVLAKAFYQKLYKYMAGRMKDIDVVTEFMINKQFYSFADAACNIAHVNTPFGQLNFLGTDPEKLTLQIDRIKASQESTPYDFEDETNITFMLTTSFHLFMQIYMSGENSMWKVIDHENLKLVYLKEDISLNDAIIEKYSGRINAAINYINSFKKEINQGDFDLGKFNFIMNGTQIRYSIQMSLANIKEFLNSPFTDEEITILKKDIGSYEQIVRSVIG